MSLGALLHFSEIQVSEPAVAETGLFAITAAFLLNASAQASSENHTLRTSESSHC